MKPYLLTLMMIKLLFGDTGLKPGDIAPDFTLMDQDSILHTLSDYKGKPVVLYFFRKQKRRVESSKRAGSAMRLQILKIRVSKFLV